MCRRAKFGTVRILRLARRAAGLGVIGHNPLKRSDPNGFNYGASKL
jgi:hypothetical protein